MKDPDMPLGVGLQKVDYEGIEGAADGPHLSGQVFELGTILALKSKEALCLLEQ
jgi:hypothetical protein